MIRSLKSFPSPTSTNILVACFVCAKISSCFFIHKCRFSPKDHIHASCSSASFQLPIYSRKTGCLLNRIIFLKTVLLLKRKDVPYIVTYGAAENAAFFTSSASHIIHFFPFLPCFYFFISFIIFFRQFEIKLCESFRSLRRKFLP